MTSATLPPFARGMMTALLVASLPALALAQRPARDQPPSIIYILSDDIAQGDLGCYGQKLIRTPHLDQMAAEGTRFTQAYCGTSVCAPSRTSLMTGLHSGHSPIRANREIQPEGQMPLPEGTFTVARLLKQAGYQTAVFGKWGMGMFDTAGSPLKVGFDHFFGYNCQRHAHSYFPTYLYDDDRRFDLPGNDGQGVGQTYAQNLIQRDLLDWISQHKDQPFFAFYAVTLPHGKFEIDDIGTYADTSWTPLQKTYAAMISRLDSDVGQLLEHLKTLGIDDQTIVFFAGDNGSSFNPQSEIGTLFDQTLGGKLRGFKRGMYEGALRQAALVRWPGHVPAGTVRDEPWAFWDFLPTAAELAGAKLPADVPTDGLSLVAFLQGGPAPSRDTFYWELHEQGSIQAIRFGNWKAVRNGPSAPVELYNLDSDPGETTDLAPQRPLLVAHAVERMKTSRTEDPNWPLRDPPQRRRDGQTQATPVHAATGIMIGEVTTASALAQVRLSGSATLVEGDLPAAPGVVEFRLSRSDAQPPDPPLAVRTATASAERDAIARVQFENLEPGVSYTCATRVGAHPSALRQGPEARFKTLPGAEAATPVRFVVVTGMNYAKFHGDDRIDRAEHRAQNNTDLPAPYAGPDKALGYPALASIVALKPDFFIGTGDNVYYDTPTKPRAETLEQMRRKWHEQFVQPRYHDLFAAVPTYWEIDDHDFRVDDCDLTGKYAPSPELGRRVMLEQLPYALHADPEPMTYRTFRVSKDLQIWLTENRWYRSPNKTPDGPDKSIWGAEQRAWLERTLAQSDATFKLLISPTPLIGPDDLRKTDNHCDIGGFQHERDAFFAWLTAHQMERSSFAIVCGDRHWQYHSIHPSGVEEFSTGALVDANSRLGRLPGDPQSTDPEGLIRQPYTQNPASGGFLQVSVTPATSDAPARLEFDFRDEHAVRLYRHERVAKP